MAPNDVLPPNLQRFFDKMGKDFDNREYAKCIRAADSILSVVPDHADSIAMKGLSLFHQDSREAGLDLIKHAISLCPKSTIAWHSLGMCRRVENNFADALRAFKVAASTDAVNTNILRDVSTTCVQVRDWEEFLKARESMLTLKPTVRANWVALACAHRVIGHPKLAAALMDVMADIMSAGDNAVAVSEAHLFRVELYLESREPQRALEILKAHQSDIKDDYFRVLLRAKAHVMLGRKADAEKAYMELITMGLSEGDSIAAMAQLRKIPLDAFMRPKHQHDKYVQLLDEVLSAAPRCDYARRHYLDCVPLDGFKERLASFAKLYITKMIPSLFSVLKSLYMDAARVAMIEEVFHQWESELVAGRFDCFGTERNPCYILWIWTFLASHYRRTGDYVKAHAYITKAIDHTPTLELLYVEKARIFARQGKTAEAAEQADFARRLDLQDKYLNSKAAKYYFRNNEVDKGEETMQIFFKDVTVPGETYLTILESQCSWYEREVGEAFLRRGDVYAALQKLLMFEVHHRHNHNEMSDFHNYVFRMNTMRTWFDVIDCDDHMGRNKYFLRFCPGLVRAYLKVEEMGEEAVRAAHTPIPPLNLEGQSPEEVKRLTKLQEDYHLAQLDLSEPLEKAKRYLGYLLEYRPNLAETHRLAVAFYTKTEKPLLVARALLAWKKVTNANVEEVASATRDFELGLYAQSASHMNGRVKAVVDELLRLTKL